MMISYIDLLNCNVAYSFTKDTIVHIYLLELHGMSKRLNVDPL